MSEIQNISDVLYDVKHHLTDYQFKTVMDNLMLLNQSKDTTESQISNEFFKQFFYHHQNTYFDYKFTKDDQSIFVCFENFAYKLKHGSTFLYEKIVDNGSIQEVHATVVRINPKYSVIEINDFQKKISNRTLAKVLNFPYIVVK